MSTIYREFHQGTNNDGFASILNEANDFFKSEHHMSILGEGIKDIITDVVAFKDYTTKFTEGLDPTEKKQVQQIFANARMQTLHEAVSGIQPHASLTMPIIRKMWARIALKYAIPTEPVKTPAFSIAFTTPYVLQPDGKKVPLPDAINSVNAGALAPVSNTRVKDVGITLEANGKPNTILPKNASQLNPIHHKLDKKATVVKAIEITLTTGSHKTTMNIDLGADLYGRLFKEIKGITINDGKYSVTLIGTFDWEKSTVMLFANVIDEKTGAEPEGGATVKYSVDGFFTHETHNESINVAIDIFKRDIEIGTGTHIENSLQLEFLQDAMNMYNIDGAAETVDVMSNIVAQKLDIEIYQFLANSAMRLEMTGGPSYKARFNLKPATGYGAGSAKDWREELKTVIDHFAIKMKSNKFFYNGYFVIIGNPLDTALIPNVNWTFNNVADDQNGIEVEYSVGAMSGSQRYTVVASDLIPQGELLMFFVPTTDKYLTYKYYPYTFNVVNDYRNALINNVPSIMMTKRHTIEEFTPLICSIEILGNDGTIPEWGTSPAL